MLIKIQVEDVDDPRTVEYVAKELRGRLNIDEAPKIDVQYPSGRVIKF